jgi:hypothetical protein
MKNLSLKREKPMPTVKIKKKQPDDFQPSNEELIEKKILKDLVKPLGYSHLEIKKIFDDSYRVNLITKTYEEGKLFPVIGRPTSWYIRLEDLN